MTAEAHIRQMLGDLMMQVAILRAELDALKDQLAQARLTHPHDRAEVP